MNRAEYYSYTRYYTYCPNCGHEHGVTVSFGNRPQIGDAYGCTCGKTLIVVQWKDETGWHLGLEIEQANPQQFA